MINILSYVGMNMQSEVCLWALLGLMRTIFDATLFKVNANLKQVWQMSMPEELSMPVQRVLRTMISGIMLVQCFTVYVYLASYIVLLYPVFLEERPTLVLPWLLLAAIRKLLCELTSLALGLGTCVLLGAAKPPCIKFLIVKVVAIMPAFYMWMLIYGYYHALKVASAFKTFPAVHQSSGLDYGLELAIRRRRTKSLFGEEQVRQKLVAGFTHGPPVMSEKIKADINVPLNVAICSDSSVEETPQDSDILRPLPQKYADIGANEDWFGSEIIIPRNDRILEQFVVMLLRIGAYLNQDGTESIKSNMFNSALTATWATHENMEAMPADMTDTPPLVGNSKGHTASYLRDYPQIFMKKLNGSDNAQPVQPKITKNKSTDSSSIRNRLHAQSSKSNKSNEMPTSEVDRIVSEAAINVSNEKKSRDSITYSFVPLNSEAQNSDDKLILFKTSLIYSNEPSDKHLRAENPKRFEIDLDRKLTSSEQKEIQQSTTSSGVPSEERVHSKLNEIKEISITSDAISHQLMLPEQNEIQHRSESADAASDKLHEAGQIKQNGVSRSSKNIEKEKLQIPDSSNLLNDHQESSIVSKAVSIKIILPKQDEIQKRSKSADSPSEKLHKLDQIRQNDVSKSSINIEAEKLRIPDSNHLLKDYKESSSVSNAISVKLMLPKQNEGSKSADSASDNTQKNDHMEENGVSKASIKTDTDKLYISDSNHLLKDPVEIQSKNGASTLMNTEPNEEEQKESEVLGNDQVVNKETVEAGPSRASTYRNGNETENNTSGSQGNVSQEKNKKTEKD